MFNCRINSKMHNQNVSLYIDQLNKDHKNYPPICKFMDDLCEKIETCPKLHEFLYDMLKKTHGRMLPLLKYTSLSSFHYNTMLCNCDRNIINGLQTYSPYESIFDIFNVILQFPVNKFYKKIDSGPYKNWSVVINCFSIKSSQCYDIEISLVQFYNAEKCNCIIL